MTTPTTYERSLIDRLRHGLAVATNWNWLNDDARPSSRGELCDALIVEADAYLSTNPVGTDSKSVDGQSVEQPSARVLPDVNALAQFIRVADGSNRMGAGELAEHIIGWMQLRCANMQQPSAPEPVAAHGLVAAFAARIKELGVYGNQREKMYLAEQLASVAERCATPPAPREAVLEPVLGHDKWRGTSCEMRDEKGDWKPARFIALDLVGHEPICQFEKRMPWFATWDSVRGLRKEEIINYYNRPAPQKRESAPAATDVLRCPFCGSSDISDGEALGEEKDGSTFKQSECQGCGALGPKAPLASGEVDYGDVKAIAAWNRRASSSPLRPVTDADVAAAERAYESDIRSGLTSTNPHRAALESFRSRLAGEGA